MIDKSSFRIIQATTSLAPEFGGTARCVTALSLELARLGSRVSVIHLEMGMTAEGAGLPAHPNLTYHKVPVRFKLGLRPIWIPAYRKTLIDLLSQEEQVIIHDNGIWLPYSGVLHQAARGRGIKLVTTIHGMLEPWALNFGRIRKKAAWTLYQRKRLEENTVLHATSRQEANQLRALGLKTPIVVLPNGTALPGGEQPAALPPDGKRICLFLSRIHPKKGLINLVHVIGRLKPSDWKVVLAGYDEGNYWDTVWKEIKRLDLEDYFEFIGPLTDQEKWLWYDIAELFILPSFSENFGLVVAEALASGTPVITTQGTPWEDLIDYNCGWWVPSNVDELEGAVSEAMAMDLDDLAAMGKNGRKLVEQKYSWPAIAARMQQVYQWVVGAGPKPPEVIP